MNRHANQMGVSMTVPVNINGLNTNMLLDTGAVVTILSTDTFDKIPRESKPTLKPLTEPVYLEVADAGQLKVEGMAMVAMEIGSQEYACEVYVAPIKDTGLLGMDFLYQHDCTVHPRQSSLCINGDWVNCEVQGDLPGVRRVYLQEDTIVPASCEVILPGMVEGKGLNTCSAIVEPYPMSNLSEKQLLVGCTLVDPQRADINIPVRLVNTGNEDVTLEKGAILGLITTVDTMEEIIAPSQAVPICQVTMAAEQAEKVDMSKLCEGWCPDLVDLYNRSITELNDDQKEKLALLLDKHKSVFSTSPDDLGRTTLVYHSIDTGDAVPIKQRPRRPPKAFEGEEEKLIQSQLKAGIIRESTSPWASPLVFVRKKDQVSVRACIDYRKINEVTKKDAYPLPRIQDCLDSLSGNSWYGLCDLTSAYHQLYVKEEDRPKTAFCTRAGLYEYITMPMGLCNAPSTFERCIELVMKGLQWQSLILYLDDCVTMATSAELLLERLDEVFRRLSAAGLKLKPSKCELFKREVTFLGHVVSEKGVKPDPRKVQCVVDWPIPRNTTDIRAFLGLCSYYRRFVQGFSTIASPMNSLLEAGQAFEWTSDCQNAFDTLKTILTSDPVMGYPKDEGLFILDTDASAKGIGVTLSQMQWCEETQQEVERPIAYASKSLTKVQRRYCVTRRELLAIVVFLQTFRHYLLGRAFLVRTDHSALRWVMSFKEPQDQMARWLELISQYDFKILHRPGAKHGNCDALSRIPCDPDQCDCYDGETVLEQLPCGGCAHCHKRHEQWSEFMEIDDIAPLKVRLVHTSTETRHSTSSNHTGGRVIMGVYKLWMLFLALLSCIKNNLEKAVKIGQRSVCYLAKWKDWAVVHGYRPHASQCSICRVDKKKKAAGTGSFQGKVSSRLGDLPEYTDPNSMSGETDSNHGDGTKGVSTKECAGYGEILGDWVGRYPPGELARLQREDCDLEKVIKWMQRQEVWPERNKVAAESPAVRNMWLIRQQLVLRQGVLYKTWTPVGKGETIYRLVVPRTLYKTIMQAMHDSVTGGHLGIRKSLSATRHSFYWYRMKETVRDWVRNCNKCGARKRPVKHAKGELKDYRVGAPMDRVAIDVLGPFPQTERLNKYILVVGDYFTRYIAAYAIPDQTASTLANTLVYEFFSIYGCPLDLHSDQGRAMESQLFQEMCKLYGIHKTCSSPFHPRSNGLIERFNHTLAQMISAYVDKEQRHWDVHLPLLTAAYRKCVHDATSYSPNYLMFGREVHMPVEILLGCSPENSDEDNQRKPSEYVADLKERLNAVYAHVREHLEKYGQRQKLDYDSRLLSHTYAVGDLVYFLDTTRVVGRNPKLNPDIWKGPCIVVQKYSALLFKIQANPKARPKVLHHDRLKPFVSQDLPTWVENYRKKILTQAQCTAPVTDNSVAPSASCEKLSPTVADRPENKPVEKEISSGVVPKGENKAASQGTVPKLHNDGQCQTSPKKRKEKCSSTPYRRYSDRERRQTQFYST